jgi:hypothetical protein
MRKYLAVGLVSVLCAGASVAHSEGRGPEVLYLNFSDGSENIVRADGDDAALYRSIMGSVSPYPAFAWPGIDTEEARRQLVHDLTEQINDAFRAYNVVVTTTRPAGGHYTMVMIGGSPALFAMDPRVAGVAYMDCENRQAANVVFAFPGPLGASAHGLFSTIAQEAAHAFGLQHSSDPNDIMYPRVDLAQRGFLDRESVVASPKFCGADTQNSHRRLLQLLGAWPGGDKPDDPVLTASDTGGTEAHEAMGGCAVGGHFSRRATEATIAWPGTLALVFALRACRRRRRRL